MGLIVVIFNGTRGVQRVYPTNDFCLRSPTVGGAPARADPKCLGDAASLRARAQGGPVWGPVRGFLGESFGGAVCWEFFFGGKMSLNKEQHSTLSVIKQRFFRSFWI